MPTKTPYPEGSQSPRLLTQAMEDYIKVIYKAEQDGDRATTILVAERLGYSAASVTNMFKRLAEMRLIEYTPYQGVELTMSGKRVALEILRHHRLLELYLKEQMGYSWDEVDAEAEELEHVISEEFEDRIDAILGFPKADPHGHPIPSKEGHLPDLTHLISLNDSESGQRVIVRQVSDRDAATLRYLGSLGLYPAADVNVLARDDDTETVRICVEGEEHTLSAEHANLVVVEVV